MLYAACGMRQIESLHVAIDAASECRIGRGNPLMTSINYDIPENPLHFVICKNSGLKGGSELREYLKLVGWWLVGWLVC